MNLNHGFVYTLPQTPNRVSVNWLFRHWMGERSDTSPDRRDVLKAVVSCLSVAAAGDCLISKQLPLLNICIDSIEGNDGNDGNDGNIHMAYALPYGEYVSCCIQLDFQV